MSTVPARPRPRVLLKAPTLAEMEEMNVSEVREGTRKSGRVEVRGTREVLRV